MTTININLLPEELRPLRGGGGLSGVSLEKGVVMPIGIGLAAAFIIALAPTLIDQFYLSPLEDQASQDEQAVTAEINKYNTTLKSLKAIGDNKEMLRQQMNTLQSVASGRTPLADQLNELRSLTPANLWFDSFKDDTTAGKVTISGVALDYASVAFFHHNLQHASFFVNPVLSKTEMSGSGKDGVSTVKFTMTVDVKTPSDTPSGAPSASPSPAAPPPRRH